MRASERRVPLAGAENFRDLGGYTTADGRTVRWGRLYRSGNLAGLTDGDVATVDGLGLRLVCDLRTAAERVGYASRLPRIRPPTRVDLAIDFAPLDPTLIRHRLLGRDIRPGELRQLMIAANRAYVTEFASQFGGVLARLADPANLPALIHCNGGKDRTGFAAALVLLALGVPRATVLEDYLLTNRYTMGTTRRRAWLVFLASRLGVRPREMRALLEARAEYLEAGLDLMEARHGSIDDYLRDALGVPEALRLQLREALLA